MGNITLKASPPGARASEGPAIAGTYTGAVVVCGSAACLWSDLARLHGREFDVMAINMAGVFLPKIPRHWVSLHAELFQWMAPLRAGELVWAGDSVRVGNGCETHSIRSAPGVRHVWPFDTRGSSGMLAARIAVALGYASVILAGIPLDESRHFYDAPDAPRLNYAHRYLDPWRIEAQGWGGKVRSMSGATRDLLGGPDGHL